MNWSQLTPVPAEDFLPDPMRQEAEQIGQAVAEILVDRRKADAFEQEAVDAFKIHKPHDGRPYLAAAIALLEREIPLRERMQVYHAARAEVLSLRRQEAQEILRGIEQGARDLAGLPPCASLPHALLASDPGWWAARQAVAGCPYPDNREPMYNGLALVQAQASLEHYRGDLAEEERRLAALAEQDRIDAQEHELRQGAESEKRDTLRAKINRLLGRGDDVADDELEAEANHDDRPSRQRRRKVSYITGVTEAEQLMGAK